MAFAMEDNIIGAVDLYTVDNVGGGPYSLVGTNAGKMGRYAYPSDFVGAVDPVLGGAFFTFAQVAPIASQAITGIAVAAGIATVTTGAAHGLSVGSVVQLSGVTPAGYNGLFTVASVPSTTTFTYNTAVILNPSYSPSNLSVANSANSNVPTTAATVMGAYVAGIGQGQIVQFVHTIDAFGNLILTALPWAGTANSGLSLGVAISNPLSAGGTFGGQFAWFQIAGAMIVYSAGAPAAGNQTYWNNGGGSSLGGFVTQAAVASKQMQGTQYATGLAATLGSGTSGKIVLPANQAVIWGSFPLAQGAIT